MRIIHTHRATYRHISVHTSTFTYINACIHNRCAHLYACRSKRALVVQVMGISMGSSEGAGTAPQEVAEWPVQGGFGARQNQESHLFFVNIAVDVIIFEVWAINVCANT